MSETDLQRAIIKALKTMGVWVIRTAVNRNRSGLGIRTGEPGMPDLYLPGLGHIEVKLPGRDLDPDQVVWHRRAQAMGVNTGVAHSPTEAIQLVHQWRRAA